MHYSFSYHGAGGWLMRALGLGPRYSRIIVDDQNVHVRFGWGFRATIPRTAITDVGPDALRTLSRGAHGWRGRWLVNGSGRGYVTMTIEPPTRAYTIGFPIRLRRLTVSAAAPTELIEALRVQ